MIVMPSNNSGLWVGWLAGTFPQRLAHLYSPGGERGPYSFMPYCLDNGVFGLRDRWRPGAWRRLLDWAHASRQAPRWVLVPDAVGDRRTTLRRWLRFEDETRRYGWPLAFAVQEGMTAADVPSTADVIFVGGSTNWKWSTAASWCARFPRVHIGRVNSYGRLWEADRMGAESTDGTGWPRGDKKQQDGLLAYLQESAVCAKKS